MVVIFTRVSDTLLVAEDRKTLAGLYRLCVEATDPSVVAHCFRASPWTADDIRRPLQDLLLQALPRGWRVYVMFDSWYASAKLIKYCRKNYRHVICALKSNRRFEPTAGRTVLTSL